MWLSSLSACVGGLVFSFNFIFSSAPLLCVFFVRHRTGRSPLMVPAAGLNDPSDTVVAKGFLSLCYYLLHKFAFLLWVCF